MKPLTIKTQMKDSEIKELLLWRVECAVKPGDGEMCKGCTRKSCRRVTIEIKEAGKK